MYSHNEQQILLSIARQSIQTGLAEQPPMMLNVADYSEALQQKRASFVTLKINGQLRGCIGTLSPYRALIEDVAHNAYAAAFSDPRFSPLVQDEFSHLDCHISILSEPRLMLFDSEADLLAQIQPGIDGLLLSDNNQQGIFLPSVWEQLPTSEEFLRHLKQKAGFAADYWSETLKVSRYNVESIS